MKDGMKQDIEEPSQPKKVYKPDLKEETEDYSAI